jgi:hypothetical protein
VAALLGRSQLVFEVYTGRSGFDHGLHQFVCVQHATETRFCIRHDRLHPVDGVVALGVVQLVCAQQGVVDSANQFRRRIGRV